MRKFCLIFALLLCCGALFPVAMPDDGAAAARSVRHDNAAVLHAEDFAWQVDCMLRCNSDLKLPSLPSVENVRRAEVQVRTLWGCDRRTLRCRVARNLHAAYDEYAFDRSVYKPGAGACAADYYLRTLRRLII